MKKIISLFKRDYEGNRQVYNSVVSGAEWVLDGEGMATIKYDGTCCKVQAGKLYKRYDRKLTKAASKRKRKDKSFIPSFENFKAPPEGWVSAEDFPNIHTGHWPGWVLVGDGPEDKWHREAFYHTLVSENGETILPDGTYELVGAKVQGNPYRVLSHHLWRHGDTTYKDFNDRIDIANAPRDFDGIKEWLSNNPVEGIVWHHPDGRMVKIKRRDFGLEWPIGGK